jgi:hypothetical protein
MAAPACGGDGAEESTTVVEFVNVAPFVSHQVVTRVVASDPAGVTRVELYLDDMRVSAVEFAPFDASWDASGFSHGVHTLKALAYTSDGRTGSAAIPIGIDHAPPRVVVPAVAQRDGQFAVDATDGDAGVARVIVQRGDQRLATLTAPPYVFAWPGGLCGSLELRVVAIDHADNETEAVATVKATDTHDLDCDGEPAMIHGGADCDDSSAVYGPRSDDPGIALEDFNCDGVPGVDADRDGVPSVATGGTDCDDGQSTIHGSWQGWTGATFKLANSPQSPAFFAMDGTSNVLNVAFVDGGLFFGRADLSRGAQRTNIVVQRVADAADGSRDRRPALLRMHNGGFAILFFAGSALKVATRAGDAEAWNIAEIDPGSDAGLRRAAVVGDDEDKLHVIYELSEAGGTSLAMRYATDRGGSWSTQRLPEQLGGAQDSVKILVDSAHRPHVIYENLTAVRHAVLSEGVWTSNTIFPDRQRVAFYVLGPNLFQTPAVVAVVLGNGQDELRRGSIGNDFVLDSFAFASVPERVTGIAVNFSDIVLQLVSRTTSAPSVMALSTLGVGRQRLHAEAILGATHPANFNLRVLLGPPESPLLASVDRPVNAPFDPFGGPDEDCDGTP